MAKTYTFEEVGTHNHKEDCWIIIHGKVYDVTSFLYDHPGGGDVFLVAPDEKDASVGFDEVGHSESAIEMLETYYVGELDTDTITSTTVSGGENHALPPHAPAAATNANHSFAVKILVALLMLALAFVVQYYYGKGNNPPNGEN
ncbi:hypothetical protein HN51_039894 [Arachis hypogaea]|uniref:Cytochrome b5 heme-binding domain-containing protein n=1 Tax=Arachis hypogaea TaxID=3818 RepID=A0A444YLA8_ARAHY|nr:cytochrome b5 [Arachis ipaensis]XP_025663775.1 cytochrome b5 [Arachis hypogaea]QHN85541.1 Cytochrome [Arachis hypogaea]RYR02743.1 hypothetical protein Ahy_B06g081554 [Arachis hypogaea]